MRTLEIEEHELVDLGGFESFVFSRPSNNSILRITHLSHRDANQILGEMEFIEHLYKHNTAVCRPLPFKNGEYVFTLGEFVMSQFEKAPGSTVPKTDWNHGLFQTWGRDIAQFHIHAQSYSHPVHKRPEWYEDENLDFAKRIPADQFVTRDAASQCLKQVAALPQDNEEYGLIHSDAHSGNFFFNQGELTFFDFDDCCYQWFVFDIATILFGAIFKEEVENTRMAQEEAVKDFLPAFLDGYDQIRPVTGFMLEEMPLFLKLREFSLYAVIHAHMDVNNIEGWYPKKVMEDRQRRIEAAEAVINLDFMQFMRG